jgi:hypothetical protein
MIADGVRLVGSRSDPSVPAFCLGAGKEMGRVARALLVRVRPRDDCVERRGIGTSRWGSGGRPRDARQGQPREQRGGAAHADEPQRDAHARLPHDPRKTQKQDDAEDVLHAWQEHAHERAQQPLVRVGRVGGVTACSPPPAGHVSVSQDEMR